MNKLDNSWKNKAEFDVKLINSFSEEGQIQKEIYLQGASDFQKRVIKAIEKLMNIKNLDETTVDLVLIEIENLKAE